MAKEPRLGEEAGFQIFPSASYEGTLGDPQQIIWSSIKYMCAEDIIHEILYGVHKITRKSLRTTISNNIKLYITQASDFYEAASAAKSNTAPLFYYYSFLNLAKALCEIRVPCFHKNSASYNHGLTWKPSPDYLVKMETESVNISTRGVWHILFESVAEKTIRLPNPLKIKVKDLFSLCPETSIEFNRTYHEETRLVYLDEPNVMVKPKTSEVWLRFGVSRNSLKEIGLSRPKFLSLLNNNVNAYQEVKSPNPDIWMFESRQTKKCNLKDRCIPFEIFEHELSAMNIFAHLGFEDIQYSIPDQRKLPIRLPQLIVLYTLIFWLGSLVRYDPHSVNDLQNSKYWILIDGYMNQSRIWLLELFEWSLYRTETTLRYVR